MLEGKYEVPIVFDLQLAVGDCSSVGPALLAAIRT